jgi:hypothetical protein
MDLVVDGMRSRRPPLFRKRKFEPTIIITGVRWYRPVLPEPVGFGGADGRTWLGGGPHHQLALGSARRTGSTPAAARYSEAKILHLVHETFVRIAGR